jgi:hypothetical protein
MKDGCHLKWLGRFGADRRRHLPSQQFRRRWLLRSFSRRKSFLERREANHNKNENLCHETLSPHFSIFLGSWHIAHTHSPPSCLSFASICFQKKSCCLTLLRRMLDDEQKKEKRAKKRKT